MTTPKLFTEYPRFPLYSFFPSITKLARWCFEKFKEDFRASLFSASLAVVLVKAGVLTIFTKLSLLLVSNLAAPELPQVKLHGQEPLVLYLSETQWQQRYLEQAPLDRCKLAADLEDLLKRNPRQLLVDFDLSPSLQEGQRACQQSLDRLLDLHAHKLVLLLPFRVGATALIEEKAAWMVQRCSAGVVFGDGGLNVSLGTVIDFVPESETMADAMHERDSVGICKQIVTPAGRDRWLRRGAEEATGETEVQAINFADFSKHAVVLAMDDPAFNNLNNLSGRDVYLGGDYGGSKDDRFLTSMGALPGVSIHAAIAWSLAHSVNEMDHVTGFAFDIFTAFVFSLGIGVFWRLYFACKQADDFWQKQCSTFAMTMLVGYFGLMLFCFIDLSRVLFLRGVLISPLLMGLSMLVDGFVRGPIGVIGEKEKHEEESEHAATAHDKPSRSNMHVLWDRTRSATVPMAWLLVAILAVALANLKFGWDLGILLICFVGLLVLLAVLLFLGLLEDMHKLSRENIVSCLLGEVHQQRVWPAGLSGCLGALVTLLRFVVYWGVLALAFKFMFSH